MLKYEIGQFNSFKSVEDSGKSFVTVNSKFLGKPSTTDSFYA
jgi:hypothetical protein